MSGLIVNLYYHSRFLPVNHPYRRDPTFGPVEMRQPPPLRSLNGDNGAVGSRASVNIVQDPDFNLKYFQVGSYAF